jgi:hypothetical protein
MKKRFGIFFLLFFAIFICIFAINKKNEVGLKGFYELTLKDPLFYSSFFDSREFEMAVKGLEESENQFKEVVMDNDGIFTETERTFYNETLEKTDIFPYQFLNSLISINKETNNFLKNPSIELAENLLSSYEVAADSYLESISSLIEVLEKEEVTENYFFILSLDSFSSFDVVKNDFSLIKENGYKLKKEISERRECLLEKRNCRILEKFKKNDFLSILAKSEEFNLTGEKIDFIKNTLPFLSSEEVEGPYKINSSCWQSQGSEQWFYLVYIRRDGKTTVLPKMATQNYYRKASAFVRGTGSKEQESFFLQGLEFVFMMDAPLYQCMDVTFYPQLLVMDFIKKEIEVGKVSREELAKKLEYKLLAENQFGLISPVINMTAFEISVLKEQAEMNKTMPAVATLLPSLSYIYATRPIYSIFYFPFAESIWRTDKELQYFLSKEKQPQKNPVFFTLDELEELGYSREQIKEFYIDR